MQYHRFRLFVTIIGAVVIAGSVIIVPGPLIAEEVFAQILLFAVFVAAVHGGVPAGLIAALSALLAYVAIRMNQFPLPESDSLDFAAIVTTRALGFLMIGLIVGWISGRIRQRLRIAEELEGLDSQSLGFNYRFTVMTLATSLGEVQRYGHHFSLIRIRFAPQVPKSTIGDQSRLIGILAETVRSSIRAVDRFGRTDEGDFVLVLPGTDKQGADSLMTRLDKAIQDKLDAPGIKVTMTSLCSTTQFEEIQEYHRGLTSS